MSSQEFLTFGDVKKKIQEHLKTAIGIEQFEITFAKQDKMVTPPSDVWRVNVEWKPEKDIFASTGLFSLDAKTGEVLEFRKNVIWRF